MNPRTVTQAAALSIAVLLSLAACNQTPDPQTTQTGAPEFSRGDLVQVEGASMSASRPPNRLLTLAPGQFRSLDQVMPVNIVFVGYERGQGAQQINEGRVRAQLPQRYETFNRAGFFYVDQNGNPIKEPIGIKFRYRYNIRYADKNFENAFFKYLSQIAVSKPLTLFQTAYNCQFIPSAQNPACTTPAANVTRPVTNNVWIDGPKVENWLADNGGWAGVNTALPTVFFINWHGRSDFKYHVYTKTDEPDPDTGYNFGELRASRKMIAWGGTSPRDPQGGLGRLARVWFHDLSAGPEAKTNNWDITNADLDGDDTLDYRMPPIWEYGSARRTYRQFNDLSGDLGKIVRNVAINLLFTTSPIYRAAITPTVLPERLKVNVQVYQGVPGFDGKTQFQPGLITKNLEELQPLMNFRMDMKDRAYTPEARAAYECVATNTTCYPDKLFGIPFASLFVYNLSILPTVLTNARDYEVPVFAYSVDDSVPSPFLGLADDDWSTATQSMVYAVDTPTDRSLGYGFTTTAIHEVGHHLALSHPHDGYDAESDTDYGPGGDKYYAWVGDESNSIMSYIDVNWNFSQFDFDNMNRYLTATYINQSNLILKRIYDEGKAAALAPEIIGADIASTVALWAYWGMQYPDSARLAKAAYETLRKSAQRAGVNLEKFVWFENYQYPDFAGVNAARRAEQILEEKKEARNRNMP
jgi:hypothetical protein